MSIRFSRAVLTLAVFALIGATAAQAEVGASLLFSTQQRQHDFKLSNDNYIFGDGTTKRAGGGNRDFELRIFEVDAWAALSPDSDTSPVVGFSGQYIDMAGSDPILPRRLADFAVGVGGNIGQWEDWKIDIVGGIGFAGTTPFRDSDARYAMADLVATKQLDQRTQLSLLLNYNGNRSIFPDVPLPAVAWTRQVDETLLLTLGFPFSRVTWRPTERVTVNATYTLPFSLDVSGEYELTDMFAVYGLFENSFSAYTPNRGAEHRRIFFRQRRVEAGMKWQPCDMAELRVGVGYGFGGEFSTGWDARDDNRLVEVSDEAYIRAGLTLTF